MILTFNIFICSLSNERYYSFMRSKKYDCLDRSLDKDGNNRCLLKKIPSSLSRSSGWRLL